MPIRPKIEGGAFVCFQHAREQMLDHGKIDQWKTHDIPLDELSKDALKAEKIMARCAYLKKAVMFVEKLP